MREQKHIFKNVRSGSFSSETPKLRNVKPNLKGITISILAQLCLQSRDLAFRSKFRDYQCRTDLLNIIEYGSDDTIKDKQRNRPNANY